SGCIWCAWSRRSGMERFTSGFARSEFPVQNSSPPAALLARNSASGENLTPWSQPMRTTLLALPVLLGIATLARADQPTSDFLKPDNWEGLMELWKIDGTTVVGLTPPEGLKFNTFLCSKKKYGDFEMRCQVRLKDGKGNSGVQIRSHIHNMKTFAVTGPQCDIGEGWWGSLYGENFGGIMKAADKDKV